MPHSSPPVKSGPTTAQGGSTQFDHLGLSIQPRTGRAILFFPSFSDGRPDARMLHTATAAAAGQEKWVCQQWVARGFGAAPKAPEGAPAAATGAFTTAAEQQPAGARATVTTVVSGVPASDSGSPRKKRGGGGGGGKGARKGFGR